MKYSLKAVNIALTNRCNLKCKHCGATTTNTDMALDVIISLVQSLKKYGVKHIIFAGGEPFCREDIFDIFDECERSEISFAILTNGTMSNKDIVYKLKQYHFLSYVRVSIDYASHEKMDAFRGMQGVFDKICMFLHLLKDAGIPFGIGLTIMDDNISEIESVAIMAKELGAAFFRASPIVAIGKSCGISHDAIFYQNAILSMFSAREKLGIGLDYPFMMLPRNLKKLNKAFLTPCPGGKFEISVMSDGSVNRCPLSVVDETINIRYMSFDEALQRISESYLPECEKCIQCSEKHICHGGCLVELENNGKPLCFNEVLEQVVKQCEKNFIRIYGNVYYEQMLRRNPVECIRSSALWVIPFLLD